MKTSSIVALVIIFIIIGIFFLKQVFGIVKDVKKRNEKKLAEKVDIEKNDRKDD